MSDQLGDRPDLAAAFAGIKEAIQLNGLGQGRDREAEGDIRAFRDGVPPLRVLSLTVGREAAASALGVAISDATKGRAAKPVAVAGRSGDGRSHLLRLAAEKAQLAGLAVAEIIDDTPPRSADELQRFVFGGTRLRGIPIAQLLASPADWVLSAGTVGNVRSLLHELTPGGTTAFLGLSEAMAAGRPHRALPILGWIMGEAIDPATRREFELPMTRGVAYNERGVLAAGLAFCRLVGAQGLVVTVDTDVEKGEPFDWLTLALPGLLTVGLLPGAASGRVLNIDPLNYEVRQSLARLIRDRHVAAYEWPNANVVSDGRLATLVAGADHGTVREWVRRVVAVLDRTHASQTTQ